MTLEWGNSELDPFYKLIIVLTISLRMSLRDVINFKLINIIRESITILYTSNLDM